MYCRPSSDGARNLRFADGVRERGASAVVCSRVVVADRFAVLSGTISTTVLRRPRYVPVCSFILPQVLSAFHVPSVLFLCLCFCTFELRTRPSANRKTHFLFFTRARAMS